MAIKKIGVIGAGTMGRGIAQTCAAADYEVLLHDISKESVQSGIDTIGRDLERLVSEEKMTSEGRERILARIDGVTELTSFADVDVSIEAVTENLDVKIKIFQELHKHCKPQAILASNTSSISLTKIAARSGRPAQVVGMHFFNPVPVMKLVEIIRAAQTSDTAFQVIEDLTECLGKIAVSVKDRPGFVVNRILIPMINEAVFAVYEGVATAKEVDTAMESGANHPLGPLALG